MVDNKTKAQTAESDIEGVKALHVGAEKQSHDSSSASGPSNHVQRQASETSAGVMQRALGGVISTLTAALSDGDASAVIKQLRGENQSLIDEIGTLTAENADLERRRAYHQKGKLEARQRCAELDEAIRDSDKQMQQLQRQLQRLQWENHDLQAAVEEAQAGQQDLKEQVVQYKKMISNTTRTEDQASDESINEKAGQLFFRVQNFAVKYFRKAQLNYNALPENVKSWMGTHIPNVRTLPPNCGIKIVSSVVSKTITSRFGTNFIFGSSGEDLVQAASMLALLGPESYTDTKPWSAMTLKMIARSNNDVLERSLNGLVGHMVLEVRHNLAKAMDIDWTPAMNDELAKVFYLCLDFFRLLHHQSARFHIDMAPTVEADGHLRSFNPVYEEDINNESDEVALIRAVEMALFPFIIKWGNEHGENNETTSVVSKAKVLLHDNTRATSSFTRGRRTPSTTSIGGVHGGA